MICIKLQGGLGNQLFQYAAAYALADHHSTKVALDVSFLQRQKPDQGYTLRNFELGKFNIDFQYMNIFDQMFYSKRSIIFGTAVAKVLYKIRPWTLYEERSLAYNADISSVTSKNSYLIGYFQSEKYFNKIESKLRDKLQFKVKLDNEISNWINLTNVVSLHIRRGDYITNANVFRFHGTCSLDYYHTAVNYIASHKSNISILIFSDDIIWAKENLFLPFPMRFMEVQSTDDLQLMSMCKFHVIANSSFSWWGAWLNNKPDKVVIAPKRWFANEIAQSQSASIIPTSWTRI